jgi:hypothetical protein
MGSKETFYEAHKQIIGLEVVKQAVESSIRLWKMSVRHSGGAGHYPSKRRSY